jgi:hypothetical protein
MAGGKKDELATFEASLGTDGPDGPAFVEYQVFDDNFTLLIVLQVPHQGIWLWCV